MSTLPSISIVVNTDGRRDSLAQTLASFRYLDYPHFEVCVIHGPTPDGTAEMLDSRATEIKVLSCPVQNISVSRNLGIGLAAGKIVAFIDDDAIPESDWLTKLGEAYQQPEITAAGGFVFGPNGIDYQWRFGTTDRLGRADLHRPRAMPELNFPLSSNFPHLLGANSSVRRAAAISIGGFDETFEYYLDETDFLCRLVDAGGQIAQLEGACVHHKIRPSHIRDKERLIRNWYPLFKNKIYYSLVNNHGHHSRAAVFEEITAFIGAYGREVRQAEASGRADQNDRMRFDEHVERAWRDGLAAGIAQKRILRSREEFAALQRPLLPFRPLRAKEQRKVFCFLSQTYGPVVTDGIGRYTRQSAHTLCSMGHEVHVFTRAEMDSCVDLEDGIWVHRVRIERQPSRPVFDGRELPEAIWDYCASIAQAVQEFAKRRAVDAIFAPIWDCEGLALLNNDLPLVTTLHTPMHFYIKAHPHVASDPSFMENFARPVLAAECALLQRSSLVMANSQAVISGIEAAYDVTLDRGRLIVVPHGLSDWRETTSRETAAAASGEVRLLYVGRLEERKGIDVLLKALDRLFVDYPTLVVSIVGDGSHLQPNHPISEAIRQAEKNWPSRCSFFGKVDDQTLRTFYRDCDVFVAPSRFESFGLVLVEAMMFAKPVVAGRAGGMVEIVLENETGILAEPGDPISLAEGIASLAEDPQLRLRMGRAGRRRFEEKFSAEKMSHTLLTELGRIGKIASPPRA